MYAHETMAIDTGNSFAALANSQPAGTPRVQLMGGHEPIDTEVEVGLFISFFNSDHSADDRGRILVSKDCIGMCG